MCARRCSAAALAALLATLAGCGGSAASLELLAAARGGIALAREAELEHQQRYDRQLAAQAEALDAAFDADVRLVDAGRLLGPEGEPVRLTAAWVIAARQGYAAGQRALQEEARASAAAHAGRLDDLAATDEALEMAVELIAADAALADRVRVRLAQVRGRWLDGR